MDENGSSRSRRLRLQFSTKSLLVLIVVVAIALSFFVGSRRLTRIEAKIVEDLTPARVHYKHKYEEPTTFWSRTLSWMQGDPKWVDSIVIPASLNESKLGQLKRLNRLDELTIQSNGPGFFNDGRSSDVDSLKELTGLTRVKRVYLNRTNISDVSGLADLIDFEFLGINLWGGNSSSLAKLRNLKRLRIQSGQLVPANSPKSQVKESLEGMDALESLELVLCSGSDDLSEVRNLPNLLDLNATRYLGLKTLRGLEGLKSLESLTIWGCKDLEEIGDLNGAPNLTDLVIRSNEKLTNLHGLQGLANLRELDLSHNNHLSDVTGLSGLKSLKTLDLSNCYALKTLEGISGNPNLEYIDLSGCPLSSLEGLVDNPRLKAINVFLCKGLSETQKQNFSDKFQVEIFERDNKDWPGK